MGGPPPAGDEPDGQPPAKASAKPARLSDFELLGELGAGAYARVLRARRRATGELCALKVMNKAFLLRERKAEAVRRERDVLEALRGAPGVLRLAFTFQDAHSLYLGTELCAGGDLHAQLARRPGGRAARWEAAFWVAQAALALGAVHAARAVHRDVKPENLLLDAAGHLRLCDFGSVRLLDAPPAPPGARSSRRGGCASFAGTAEYVAPEMLDGAAATPAADFWSLGCVLFQLLAGRPPFKGATEYLTFQAVLARQLQHPDDTPPDARVAVDALLCVDPTARCDGAQLRQLPFFSEVPWADIWHAQPPPVLPPRPEEQEEADGADDALWGPGGDRAAAAQPPVFALAALRDALPFVLEEGEAELRSCTATRKRGLARDTGRLVLTTLGRLALLPERGAGGSDAPLLLAACAATARAHALDERHLAVCFPEHGQVFLELMGQSAVDWQAAVASTQLSAS